MLKTMRASFHKLKWTLFAVIIVFLLGFVFWQGGPSDDPAQQVVAKVGDQEILAAEFDRIYRVQLQRYQEMYRGSFTPQLARALDLPRQVLDGMINRILQLKAARRLNLTVSDEEVADAIRQQFQEDGHFIGTKSYEKLLRANGMLPELYEESVREDLLARKYVALVKASVLVADSEVSREFSSRNDKATIEYVLIPASRLPAAVEPTETEVAAFYAKNRQRYRTTDQRRIKYLLVDRARIRSKTTVTEPELKAEYERRRETLTAPAQANVSHILIKVDADTTEEQARAKAEALSAQINAGGDFAKLAEANTEDLSGKNNGGRLPPFGRGQMVPAFEQAVFSMEPGQIGVVKTEFGWHVIQLHSRTPGGTRPIEEVRPSLEAELADRKAAADSERIARELGPKLSKMTKASEEDLRKLQNDAVTYNTTEWVSKGEPIPAIGASAEFTEKAWSVPIGQISPEPVATGRGIAFVRPSEERPAGVPPLDEIRAKVTEDWRTERREKDAIAALEPAVRELSSGGTLVALASRYETEVKTTAEFGPGGPIPEIGQAPKLSEAVFATFAGQAGPPVPAPGGFVIFRVLTKQQADPKTLETQKPEILDSLREREADRLLRAHLQRMRIEEEVEVNDELLGSFLPAAEEAPARG